MITDLDLTQFVDKERPLLAQPWSRGDYTYATNGHILVRVPRRADVEENSKAPDIGKVWPLAEPPFRPRPGFTFPDNGMVECHKCDGRGFDHDCSDCTDECFMCEGTGEVTQDEARCATICGQPFAMKYIRQIFALSDLLLPTEIASRTKGPGPMWFRFAGGDGLLMPLLFASDRENWDIA